MSARDYERYHDNLSTLQGRKAFATLATNSIKLHIDENKKDGEFVWIDPPWEFYRDGNLVESSDSYPSDGVPDYDERVRQWFSGFDSIYETAIAEIAASPDGALEIRFFGGGEIFVPSDESVRDDLWYDHWYYKDAQRA
jgi:hypothetical protein